MHQALMVFRIWASFHPYSPRPHQHARLQADPCRMAGMEFYSSVLWHMRRDWQLASLAQSLLALDRQAPHVRAP